MKKKLTAIKDEIKNTYNVSVLTSDDLISFLQDITSALTFALIFFGLVSSVVASIGIINTMIMSIYEQTREIGILKAIWFF
jgi:putative ABC transport system permease protein